MTDGMTQEDFDFLKIMVSVRYKSQLDRLRFWYYILLAGGLILIFESISFMYDLRDNSEGTVIFFIITIVLVIGLFLVLRTIGPQLRKMNDLLDLIENAETPSDMDGIDPEDYK